MTTPAERIFQKFGGPEKVAGLLGITTPRVKRWTYPEVRGGTGGRIPSKHQHTLLSEARERGVDLSPADFFECEGMA
jgi:hypothetical protein